MKIRQYLQDKYGVAVPTTLTSIEADCFGIPYPLTPGWLKQYGDIEIGRLTLAKVKERLTKRGARQNKKGKNATFTNKALAVIARGERETARLAAVVGSTDFLRSYEWRKLRMQALKYYGNRCQCCGADPARGAIINVDHIKPRKQFPELALDLINLQVLCEECNHGKGNWDETDWRNPTDFGRIPF